MHYRYIPAPTPTPPPAPLPVVPVPAPPVVAPTVAHAGPKFIFAVAQQPVELFPTWKALGVNCLVDVPLNHDPVAWKAAADAAGLYQIRQVIGDAKEDAKDPWLLAWAHHDEPELNNISVAQLKAERDATAALGIPWFVNVDGSRLLGIQPPPVGTDYKAILATADWCGCDVYAVSGWNLNIDLYTAGLAADKLSETSGGKPIFVYVECCRQGLGWLPNGGRAPTIAEMNVILRQAVSRKVKGIILFPFQLDRGWPQGFKGTDAEHDDQIAQWAEKLTK